ncbi:MAG TPA: hypothetical protein VGW33_07925 [Terriglobia bacterium]|nr:hypothetical protein [Terriglobia bacterium]
MKRTLSLLALAMLSLAFFPGRAAGQKPAALSEEEEDKLRDAQDPSQRIEVYLSLAQSRLTQFQDFRSQRHDPQYDNGGYLDKILDQYVDLDDELKDWIDDQYGRDGDMRKGLRTLLEKGPQQLAELRSIQQTPDAYAHDYRETLQDAIADLSDTLDGATQALAGQEKKFAAEKREEKAQTENAKESAKDARKQQKEEKKLRKKEDKLEKKQGVPADPDQQD